MRAGASAAYAPRPLLYTLHLLAPECSVSSTRVHMQVNDMGRKTLGDWTYRVEQYTPGSKNMFGCTHVRIARCSRKTLVDRLREVASRPGDWHASTRAMCMEAIMYGGAHEYQHAMDSDFVCEYQWADNNHYCSMTLEDVRHMRQLTEVRDVLVKCARYIDRVQNNALHQKWTALPAHECTYKVNHPADLVYALRALGAVEITHTAWRTEAGDLFDAPLGRPVFKAGHAGLWTERQCSDPHVFFTQNQWAVPLVPSERSDVEVAS